MAPAHVIGKTSDSNGRCALCNFRLTSAYQLSQEYIKELRGNRHRDCIHFDCLLERQAALRTFPFVKITLDDNEKYFTGPYASDNEIVLEDSLAGRQWVKDAAREGLSFFWDDKQFFIEPQRSVWLRENTSYPRNFLVSASDDRWWLYLPKNQALMYKLTWGGIIEDAYPPRI